MTQPFSSMVTNIHAPKALTRMSDWKQHKRASTDKWKSKLLCSSVMCCFSIYLLMISGKESASQHRRCGFDPWVWKIPWRREWQPIPVFLPGKIPWTRGTWQATVHGVARVGHSWATKQVCSTTRQTTELPVHMTAGMNLRNIALISGRTGHQAVPSVLFFFFNFWLRWVFVAIRAFV